MFRGPSPKNDQSQDAEAWKDRKTTFPSVNTTTKLPAKGKLLQSGYFPGYRLADSSLKNI